MGVGICGHIGGFIIEHVSLGHPRCGADSLDDFARHFAEQSLDELESIDISSLANAFSKVACRNKDVLRKLGDRLCADASSTLLPPVATTMALNAFAVLKHCERELFTVLVSNAVRTPVVRPISMLSFQHVSVLPRVAFRLPYTVALSKHDVQNGSLTRCSIRRPCVSDFTVTQAALVVDALARCSEVTLSSNCSKP